MALGVYSHYLILNSNDAQELDQLTYDTVGIQRFLYQFMFSKLKTLILSCCKENGCDL